MLDLVSRALEKVTVHLKGIRGACMIYFSNVRKNIMKSTKIKSATQPRICFTALTTKRKISLVKTFAVFFLRDSSRRWKNQYLIDSLHLATMRVKRKRETDETFLLVVVYFQMQRTQCSKNESNGSMEVTGAVLKTVTS